MSVSRVRHLVGSVLVLLMTAAVMLAQQSSPTPAQSMREQFVDINQRILDMARDFPEGKYAYRPSPGVRSFADVIVHVTSGNEFAAKNARGEKAEWDELDPARYKTKAEVVKALESSIADATTSLKAVPDHRFTKSLEPLLHVVVHAAEHYGQLVAYYRANGLTPPASRKK
jgi:uncharacterized damage-inducible protein DinB